MNDTNRHLIEQRLALIDIAQRAIKSIEDSVNSVYYRDILEELLDKDEYYYCYRNGCELITKSEDEVYEWIGSEWGPYEVLDSRGHSIEGFIPF